MPPQRPGLVKIAGHLASCSTCTLRRLRFVIFADMIDRRGVLRCISHTRRSRPHSCRRVMSTAKGTSGVASYPDRTWMQRYRQISGRRVPSKFYLQPPSNTTLSVAVEVKVPTAVSGSANEASLFYTLLWRRLEDANLILFFQHVHADRPRHSSPNTRSASPIARYGNRNTSACRVRRSHIFDDPSTKHGSV